MSANPAERSRPVIYQALVRIFGNTNETRKPNGSLAENGCGKFADFTDPALAAIRDLGCTHLWLTGAHEQASGTAWPDRPADDPDILKGIAGSPYAIRDYFDVCPDYATDPARRLEEFKELLARCRRHGLAPLIDFVPNHVARSYASDVKPELSFGSGDDRTAFFARDNHFYYLRDSDPGGGPPLRLPTAGKPGCDGLFGPEREFGRVSGNNVISWSPSAGDWYETVKLNYGHDFTRGRDTSQLPGPDAAPAAVPRTWRTMDEILAYWQQLGVAGFRVDMAHMIPLPFWHWAVTRARARQPGVFFCAEAYDNDPAKLTDGHVLDELLEAGFDAVYDDPAYDALEGIYDDGKWANDLDPLTFTGRRFHQSLRYAENHDEVRLANPMVWGGHGMKVGRPVSAVLFGLGRGPVMLYHGQEVGEPAAGAEGFGGDDARTSIFDYWCMPEFAKWVNGGRFDGGRLSAGQRALRDWYRGLLQAIRQPAFVRGGFHGLNHANKDNPAFGRLAGETVSGHWLYAFLRHDAASGQSALMVANFHPTATLREVRIRIPDDARRFLERMENTPWRVTELLDAPPWEGAVAAGSLATEGLAVPDLTPCSARVLEVTGGRKLNF
jgi:glycosidase